MSRSVSLLSRNGPSIDTYFFSLVPRFCKLSPKKKTAFVSENFEGTDHLSFPPH